ncbi:eukaryotic translation initiation factor [Salix suchowensis]|nr:eukaryotic translation initiation factor [Salix suchowensis]
MASTYDYDDAPTRHDEQTGPEGYDPNFVPDSVKSFVTHLYRHIREKNVYEIYEMYETSFQTLSDRFFKDSPWPSVDAVATYVDNDRVFACFIVRCGLGICMQDFLLRLNSGLIVGIIIAVFFRNTEPCLFTNANTFEQWSLDEGGISINPPVAYVDGCHSLECVWSAELLASTGEKSTIIQILEREKEEGVYATVIGSHITAIYHYGFANLMLRRYVDAIREFNKILLHIYKTKQYHHKSSQYEQILKKNEQMYALLAICLSLCQQVKLLDETVNAQLREKYGEKMARMQRYDDEAFAIYDELFSYACPKFITPSAPSFEEPLVNYNQDAYRLQLKLFLYEVKQQQLLSGVRIFLKVYSTISLGKLANYMEVDEPTLRTILMTYKHKTHAVDSEGKIISNADVDFYIDDDMIHVVDTKPVRRYGDYFLRQIVKLEGVMNEMDR